MVLTLTGLGWSFRQKIERRIDLENKLRDERIETYNKILEPFIIMLMTDAAWKHTNSKGKDRFEIASNTLLSLEYRKTAFKMSLVGSDAVVLAYNALVQHFFNSGSDPASTDKNAKVMLKLLGTFLLEIRRSMGNDTTSITNVQMLEWFITDARTFA